ncbi:MAG TPA: amidohydrolase family protein [Burkholderiaceae bacterium]|nr:amidohydrolase family protein [Burkholderiaceae bacterium]
MPPPCPAPPAEQRRSSRLLVPAGAVDCHAHVIGSPPEYPFVPQRSFTPPPAAPKSYLAMLDATSMTYGVLIQVSVHGTDNRLLVQTLSRNRSRLRGIAVMPLGLPESAYAAAKGAGVRGLRLNDLYGGGIDFSQLREYGALAREMGWHLQFLLDVRRLPELAPAIAALPVPYVVDHMGHFPVAEVPLSDARFQTLVGLVRDGGWVKLSGAYRLSAGGALYEDTVPYAQCLFDVAPTRCVWGSDWPHVAHWKTMMGVDDLLDTLALWVPAPEAQRAVLVDNPATLYGFDRTAR